jgi:hypothetical protein
LLLPINSMSLIRQGKTRVTAQNARTHDEVDDVGFPDDPGAGAGGGFAMGSF